MQLLFKRLHTFRLEYSLIGLICFVFLIFLLLVRNQTNVFITGVLALCLSYLAWGIFHHSRKQDLHPSIILEYLVFILFALSILFLSSF